MKVLLLGAFLTQIGLAQVIIFGSEAVTVRISQRPETLFRFSQEVRTISRVQNYEITPADRDQPNYTLLKIKPRFRNVTDNVVFVLSDGTVIKVHLVSQKSSEGAEGIYEFKLKENSLKGEDVSLELEFDLMKALIQEKPMDGFDIKTVSEKALPDVRGVKTTLIKKYVGSDLIGYVFDIENISSQNLAINLQKLVIGNPNTAIISNVEPANLGPSESDKAHARLRVIAKRQSTSDELVLPLQIGERK